MKKQSLTLGTLSCRVPVYPNPYTRIRAVVQGAHAHLYPSLRGGFSILAQPFQGLIPKTLHQDSTLASVPWFKERMLTSITLNDRFTMQLMPLLIQGYVNPIPSYTSILGDI